MPADNPNASVEFSAGGNRFAWGAAYGIASSIGYTATNVCLRQVSSLNPIWVSFLKALPTMALAAPWLIWAVARNKGAAPRGRQWWWLVMGGVVGQLGGNISLQWAFDVIGLAMAVPLTTGSLIVAGAWLSRQFLGETQSRQNMFANAILVGAVAVLSLGARDALQAVRKTTEDDGMWLAVLGIGAACLPGIAYSMQNIALRKVLNEGCHLAGALLTIASTGAAVAILWLTTAGNLGDAAKQCSPMDYRVIVAAGVLNALSFVALSLALRWSPIWFVYALSSSQVSMAAVLGVWVFQEPLSWSLVAGVALTVVGLLAIRAGGD